MKLIMLITFILISCGKDQVKNSLPPTTEELIPEQSVQNDDKVSLSYLEISGFDSITGLNGSFKIPTKNLKLFSIHSPVVFNFDEPAKKFIKQKLLYWEDIRIIFKFDEDGSTPYLNLKLTNGKQRQNINPNNQVYFKIPNDEINHFWESINPIEIWVENKNDNLIKVPLELHEKIINQTDQKSFELNASNWFKEIDCHITHNKIITHPRRTNSSIGSANSLQSIKVNYKNLECLDFSNRIVIENEFRSLNIDKQQVHFNNNNQLWNLKILPSTGNGRFRHGKHYYDYDQIDWFNITINWIE